MAELPDIWRAELWHPLTVHFPIALLVFAMLTRLANRFIGKSSGWLINTSRLLLYAGTVFAWIAVYTGNLADTHVARSLCDPTVVEHHERLSYITGWVFTSAVLLDLTRLLPLKFLDWIQKSWKEWLIIGLLLAGTSYLGYTSHLGARLVYQQAAGVHQPADDCREFE